MVAINHLNHALQGVKQSDVKFVSLCLYKAERYENLRYNLSVKFAPDSQYTYLHNGQGFLKLVFQPTTDIRMLRRHNHHPLWEGFTTIEEWRKAELQLDKLCFVSIGKGKFCNARGNKLTPQPAYYTLLGVSILQHNDTWYPYCKVMIGDFTIEFDLIEVSDNENFSHITYEEIYHD